MAQRSKKRPGLRGFIVLMLIVFIGGIALKANGLLVSPFEFSALVLNEHVQEEPTGFTMVTLDTESSDASEPSADATAVTEQRPRPEGLAEDGVMPAMSYTLADYFSFSWDEIGEVFYNLWVMMALTVMVIIVGRPIGWIVKHFQKPARRPRTDAVRQTQFITH